MGTPELGLEETTIITEAKNSPKASGLVGGKSAGSELVCRECLSMRHERGMAQAQDTEVKAKSGVSVYHDT